MTEIIAQTAGGLHNMTWSFEGILIAVIIVAGIVAIVVIALRAMNVTIPQWVIQILWIVAIVVVAVLAVKFLMTLF